MKKKTFVLLLTNLLILGLLSSQIASAQEYRDTSNDIGHTFDESLWAVEYDFKDNYCKEDLTGSFEDPGKDDKDEDATFYIVYVNELGIEMAYFGMEYLVRDGEIAWTPYQTIFQHWKTESGEDVFVSNTFAGLIAYDDIDQSGNPSKLDDLYIGWSFYQNRIMNIAETELTNVQFNITTDPDDFIDIDVPEKKDDKVTWGIEYRNIFTIWQKLEVYDDYEETLVIPEGVRAISMMDHLSFEYEYEVLQNEDKDGIEAEMSITYDIGQMSLLVVFGDNETEANYFGGYNGTTTTNAREYGVYNSSQSIQQRLNGSLAYNVPAMGLSMLHYVNTITLSDEKDYEDENGEEIDDESENEIDEIDIYAGDDKIFNTDFEIKDEYSLYNDTNLLESTLKVNNRLVTEASLEAKFFEREIKLTGRLVEVFANQVTPTIADQLDVEEDLSANDASYFYLISFPKWDGYEIVHDPVFTAFAKLPDIFPWPIILIGFIVAVIALIALNIMIRNKKQLILNKKLSQTEK